MITKMIEDGCRVGFFGLGCSNLSLMVGLDLGRCHVTLRSDVTVDRAALPGGIRIDRIFDGTGALRSLDEDIIFFSPSVRRDRPELIEASARGMIFSSDAELFYENNRRPIFAVSGSDGKSTTATLTHLLLKESGVDSRLIGNIGEPMALHNNDAEAYVCELSSFMLSYARPNAVAGCITNITPNHLDWHKSYEEYRYTKISLLSGCDKGVISEKCVYINGASAIVGEESDYSTLREIYKADLYMTREDGFIRRNGERIIRLLDVEHLCRHDIQNLMMAIAMTDGCVSNEQIIRVAKKFNGLPHRCECFASIGGVLCIDSSIDSTPARTAATLRSLGKRVLIILGGRGKGLDYREMLPDLKRYVTEALITGENAEEIASVIKGELPFRVFDTLSEATEYGIYASRDVGTLLLSPASTSYDRYKSYAERGDIFKKICRKMM